jgi:hypothetical protein
MVGALLLPSGVAGGLTRGVVGLGCKSGSTWRVCDRCPGLACVPGGELDQAPAGAAEEEAVAVWELGDFAGGGRRRRMRCRWVWELTLSLLQGGHRSARERAAIRWAT